MTTYTLTRAMCDEALVEIECGREGQAAELLRALALTVRAEGRSAR